MTSITGSGAGAALFTISTITSETTRILMNLYQSPQKERIVQGGPQSAEVRQKTMKEVGEKTEPNGETEIATARKGPEHEGIQAVGDENRNHLFNGSYASYVRI